MFLIDHSNEQVYIPDDGSFEFKGPSRAYGYEAKASVAITRQLSLNGGVTKIGECFFPGRRPPGLRGQRAAFRGECRADAGRLARLERFAAHARHQSLPAGWRGSVDRRVGPHGVRSGHVAKQLRRGVELNLSLDNLTNRDYYETQNYFESRVTPGCARRGADSRHAGVSADGRGRSDVPAQVGNDRLPT